jgi:hypothetical protein
MACLYAGTRPEVSGLALEAAFVRQTYGPRKPIEVG